MTLTDPKLPKYIEALKDSALIMAEKTARADA
jgi:hypothetical protein